jgi:hypothetical protein
MLPFVAVSYFRAFGPPRSIYYPLLFLANALVDWILGLWLATVYTDHALSRFMTELRRCD